MKLPAFVGKVQKFKADRKVYLVGGAVRDLLMKIEPKDFDFVVEGKGFDFGKRFAKFTNGAFVPLSVKDDEARVVKDDCNFDFNGLGNENLERDLMRRDFTINALAIDLDQTDTIIDIFDGITHLTAKKLRLTSRDSLRLDPLRILRGFRFAVELGFTLQKDFFAEAKKIDLEGIARERISYELVRIMQHDESFEAIKQMDSLNIFLAIFPEAQLVIKDRRLWKHSLATYQAIEMFLGKNRVFKKYENEFRQYFAEPRKRALLKLAGLLHDIAKPHTQMVGKRGETHFYGHDAKGAKLVERIGYERLKISRTDIDTLVTLVREHMRLHLLATGRNLTDRAIRRFFRDLDTEYLGAMILAWADGYATAGRTRHLEKTFYRMLDLKRADESKPKVKRLITGHDLIDRLKLTPGPIFKIVLNEVLDQQLEGKIKTKEEALKLAKKVYKENAAKKDKT